MPLATAANGELWTANLFYCFDEGRIRLLFYTSPDTRHGRLPLAEPRVAATSSATSHGCPASSSRAGR